jgi:uncharacterized RDD family membrane protein YckC
MLSTRLLALATLSWAMICPLAILAQTNEANADIKKTGNHRDQWVEFGKDVELMPADSARVVVVIGGSAIIRGSVDEQVVVIGGNAEIDGEVAGDVVTVMGSAQLGPKAHVGGQLVTVGGTNTVAEGGKVVGEIVDVGSGMVPAKFMKLRWLTDWVSQCVFELRPLSLGVGWIWWIAGFFFVIYFLIALLFPHPVQCCVEQISARPATTFAAGILTKLAVPILCLLLCVTVLGIAVVPFLLVAICLTGLVGKVAVLEYLGGKICGAFGLNAGQRPLVSFLIGAVLLTLLYLVPVIGLLTFCAFSWWGMGAGATAVIVALRTNRRPPAPPSPGPAAPPPTSTAADAPQPISTAGMVTPVAPALAPPSALAYPRAGFWERMAAGFLDMVLIMLSSALVGPLFCLVAIAYFSALWAWKGTTVGGIVLNLQVVRQDGYPLNFLTAFVRSLAALFSAMVLFLGFFWIGWDRDKQGWHDKIAGTVVVRLPRSVSLVCI